MQLNSTQLFLLGLVREGVNSYYRLRRDAELSPGTTQRYLADLQQAGLVEQAAKSEELKRREFRATARGKAAFKPAWQAAAARADQVEFSSVVRVAALGCAIDPDQGADFLERVAANRARLAAEQQREATKSPIPEADLVGIYSWLRAIALAEQYAAEAETFRAVAAQVRSARLKSPPARPSGR